LAKRKKISFSYFVPAILWALFILMVCLVSPKYIPVVEFNLFAPDKLAHLLLFGLLCQLLAWGSVKNRLSAHRDILLAMGITIVYGALIELLQMLMRNGRSADIDDILADAAGAFLVYLFYIIFYRSLNNRINRSAEKP
jgi:VanZ family protein